MTGSERFGPASALLAVLLAATPLTLPARFLGPIGVSGPARTAAAVSRSITPAILHLRLAALSAARAQTHTIAPGETLWDISRTAGVSIAALASANHIAESGTLHPGQVLVIPAGASAPAASPATRTSSPMMRRVAPGDTLWEIARASYVSVAALAEANYLSPDAILHPGQVLNVPPPGTLALDAPEASRPARTTGRAPTRTSIVALGLQLHWPSSGWVSSRFGWRIHPIFGTREFHTGVDIASRWGAPVMAARSGIVRFAGWMGGYGRLIVLDHGGGLQTMYSHLSAMLVGSGQRVDEGQQIGRIGSTGWSTGPHLFFEVRQNGVPLDPIPYLR